MRRCLLCHDDEIVRSNGFTTYLQCKRSGRRAVEQVDGGYQPIDWGWINTGIWSNIGKPPCGGSILDRQV